MLEHPRVTCILVNWNGWRDTIDCLRSLEQCTYSNFGTVVVDNGSTDSSLEELRSRFPGIPLLEAQKNLGFAGGNNIGIRYALAHGADYLWLLNNDTKPDPKALAELIEKALTDRTIGAVASICYYADSPEKVQVWAGASVNLWIGYGRNSTESHPDIWFDSLYGASMLVSSAAARDAGLLDEGFFHYWEETEFCLRLRKRGWLLAAAPKSRVLHKVGASTGRRNPILDRYFTTSGLRILALHSPAPWLAMTLFAAARLVRRLVRFQFSRCKNVLAGIEDYRQTLPIVQRIR
jgi:GT2 family glycosyltransferase